MDHFYKSLLCVDAAEISSPHLQMDYSITSGYLLHIILGLGLFFFVYYLDVYESVLPVLRNL